MRQWPVEVAKIKRNGPDICRCGTRNNVNDDDGDDDDDDNDDDDDDDDKMRWF